MQGLLIVTMAVLLLAGANARFNNVGFLGPLCGPNERLYDCGYCKATCDDIAPGCHPICTSPECGCDYGYVEHEGTCILASDCPSYDSEFPALDCGPNQRLYNCGYCTATCDNLTPVCTSPYCDFPECGCDYGYVEHEGTCIPSSDCPQFGGNLVWG